MRLLVAILTGVFLSSHLHAAAKPAGDASAYDAREALAKLQAMDIFPEMEEEDSDFANAVSTEVECLECEEPGFFKSPAWPLRAAWRVAARLGVKGRKVAEIREHLKKDFELDADAFRQVHGIQILSARFTIGGETLDVTPQLAARVTGDGFTVDCGQSLAVTLADDSKFERNTDESNADFWKRQRQLLAAIESPVRGAVSLRITFEFHSEQATASAKEGERIAISEDGEVSVSKIAPAARRVQPMNGMGAAPKAPRPLAKPAGKPAFPKR